MADCQHEHVCSAVEERRSLVKQVWAVPDPERVSLLRRLLGQCLPIDLSLPLSSTLSGRNLPVPPSPGASVTIFLLTVSRLASSLLWQCLDIHHSPVPAVSLLLLPRSQGSQFWRSLCQTARPYGPLPWKDRCVGTRAWGPATQRQVLGPSLLILRGFRMNSASVWGGEERFYIPVVKYLLMSY